MVDHYQSMGHASFNEETPMGTSNRRVSDDVDPIAAERERAGGAESGTRESAQSGVRAAPAFGARLEAALSASARTEATLADLFRTAKFLSATIASVREANAVL